jgi:hypothetical protein
MAIPSRQIGWGTESNLLWQILKQLNKLTSVLFGLKEAATPNYKVYTALLSQNGGSEEVKRSADDPILTIGVTYWITENVGNPDFTIVGAPNNEIGTYFIATGTNPNWGEGGAELKFNTGAPVATVLENTIGDIWFTYNGQGNYWINTNNLLPLYKTAFFGQSYYNLNNAVITTLNSSLYEGNTDDYIRINAAADLGSGLQLYDGIINGVTIEIRVYN